MATLTLLIGQLLVCAALILWAGARLSRYGDMIAEKTGMGGTWVGLVLLAAVTSMPELITGASAVLIFDVPDIAAGDALGSCMFNLLILACLDASMREPLSARIHQGHVLSAAFGIVQLGTVSLTLFGHSVVPMLGWIGAQSLLFLGVYVLAIRTLFDFERARLLQVSKDLVQETAYDHISLRRACALYAATAIVLICAAVYLPGLAERIGTETGIAQSVVGSILVAIVTSLPEAVVSVAAARMGALDMAAANLLGSNLFNVAVLGLDDILYTRGSIFAAVSPLQTINATGAVMMTAVAIVGLTYRASRKPFPLAWDSLANLLIYATCTALLAALA